MKIPENIIREEQEFRAEFQKQLLTLVTAAFGFTAAFFWNSAIKNIITSFIPGAETWYLELGVAILVTIIAVFCIYLISRVVKPKSSAQVQSVETAKAEKK